MNIDNNSREPSDCEVVWEIDGLKGTSQGLTWAIINLTTPSVEAAIDLSTIQTNTSDLYSLKQHTNQCKRFMRNHKCYGCAYFEYTQKMAHDSNRICEFQNI